MGSVEQPFPRGEQTPPRPDWEAIREAAEKARRIREEGAAHRAEAKKAKTPEEIKKEEDLKLLRAKIKRGKVDRAN